MVLRLQGLVLYLILPLAIYLLIAQPIHPLGAVCLGVVLLLVHRPVATPFIVRNIQMRCLWSGREIAPGCNYEFVASGVERSYFSYFERQRVRAARFLTLCHNLFWPLRILVLGPLAFFVVMEIVRHAGVAGGTGGTVNRAVFVGIVGLVCVIVFVAQWFVKPIPFHSETKVRFPFPAHVIVLLGIFASSLLYAAFGLYGVVYTVMELTQTAG